VNYDRLALKKELCGGTPTSDKLYRQTLKMMRWTLPGTVSRDGGAGGELLLLLRGRGRCPVPLLPVPAASPSPGVAVGGAARGAAGAPAGRICGAGRRRLFFRRATPSGRSAPTRVCRRPSANRASPPS